MTDYRRTDEELWDEDALAEEEQTVRVITRLASGLEPLRPTPPVNDTPAQGAAAATFASARPPALPSGASERKVRALTAHSLLGSDDVDEDPAPLPGDDTHVGPPPLPPDVPSEPPPPSPLTSPPSAREETTLRMTAIPLTHPLAHSIAPGGRVSARPAPRRASPLQLVLGSAALLALGASAASYLQSRGEHHAATGAHAHATLEESPSTAPTAAREPLVPPPPIELAAPAASTTTPVADLAAVREPEGLREARPALLEPRPSQPSAAGATAQLEQAVEVRQTPVQPGAATAEPSAAVVGASDPALPRQPSRDEIGAALEGLSEQLQACAGEHRGDTEVTLTVRGSGEIVHAELAAPLAGTAQGRCLVRVLRQAKLRAFARPFVRVAHTLQI